MKKAFIFFSIMALCAACNSDKSNNNAEIAAEKGREAAIEVINTPSESMAREKALLSIKAMHNRIMEAGDTAAAKIYLETAEQLLDSAKIITKKNK